MLLVPTTSRLLCAVEYCRHLPLRLITTTARKNMRLVQFLKNGKQRYIYSCVYVEAINVHMIFPLLAGVEKACNRCPVGMVLTYRVVLVAAYTYAF